MDNNISTSKGIIIFIEVYFIYILYMVYELCLINPKNKYLQYMCKYYLCITSSALLCTLIV